MNFKFGKYTAATYGKPNGRALKHLISDRPTLPGYRGLLTAYYYQIRLLEVYESQLLARITTTGIFSFIFSSRFLFADQMFLFYLGSFSLCFEGMRRVEWATTMSKTGPKTMPSSCFCCWDRHFRILVFVALRTNDLKALSTFYRHTESCNDENRPNLGLSFYSSCFICTD